MAWKKKKHREKHKFKSYYCVGCRQRKPCGSLIRANKVWDKQCCPCYYQEKRESSQEYTNYQQVYQREKQAGKARIQQLKLLREYSGCSQCDSKEVDAYELFE